MPRRLRKEEVVTVQVLAEKGQNHCEIGRVLGVTGGTVRYHLRRAAAGAEDRRKQRVFKAGGLSEVIAAWFAAGSMVVPPKKDDEEADYEHGCAHNYLPFYKLLPLTGLGLAPKLEEHQGRTHGRGARPLYDGLMKLRVEQTSGPNGRPRRGGKTRSRARQPARIGPA